MTTATSVEEILRPLAASGESRFDVLRETYYARTTSAVSNPYAIPTGYRLQDGVLWEEKWRVDASLGAIVRAAAASGLSHLVLEQVNNTWRALLQTRRGVNQDVGATPEEAAGLALVAAVGDEKRSQAAPQNGG